MDEYRSIPLFRLVNVDDVLKEGHKIYGSLWVYKIKFDGKGVFQKLNPRWCIMGGDMDKELYNGFNEVVMKVTVRILIAIRACVPGVLDFQWDDKNAFQTTPATAEAIEKCGRPATDKH